MWQKLAKVIGILTDLLTVGRKAGWWEKKQGADWKDKDGL